MEDLGPSVHLRGKLADVLMVVMPSILLLITPYGCGRDEANEEIRAQVLAAIDGYASIKHDGPVLAKATIRRLGDEAIPHLQAVLRSHKGNHLGALCALRDLGTQASFAALVEVLEGRTRASSFSAVVFISSFLKEHNWSADQARAIPGLTGAALDYVKNAADGFTKRRACQFAVKLSLRESAPFLRRYARDADYRTRLAARNALCSLTGERIPIERPVERFIDTKVDTSLFSCKSAMLGDRPIVGAHLSGGGSGDPLLVVATLNGSTTAVREYNVSFEETGGFVIPMIFHKFLVSPHLPAMGEPWIVATVAPSPGARPFLAAAFDRNGTEIWRYESPGGHFVVAAWAYGEHGDPCSVVLRWTGGPTGTVVLSLTGNEEWRTAGQSSLSLCADRCVRDRFLDKGIGRMSLLDGRYKLLAKTPGGKASHHISDAAVIPREIGSLAVAASRRGPDSLPELALYDASLKEIWCIYPRDPIRHVAALTTSCGNDSLVLAVTHEGELMAFDLAGVLRWRGPAFQDRKCGLDTRGLESWSHPAGIAAWVLTYTEHAVAVCKHSGSE